jgi:phage portal protein BeeE
MMMITRRRQPTPTVLLATHRELKLLDLASIGPEALRVLVGGDGQPADVEQLYHSVGPLYAAVMLRAQALAGLPWRLRTLRGAVRALDQDALADLLVATEIDYLLHGAAYWLRDPTAPLGLRRLHPRTISIESDPQRGLIALTRRIGERVTRLEMEQVAWLWEPSAQYEIGPGAAPVARAVAAARMVLAQEQYVASYFERGAVRPTVWMFKSPPPEPELTRFRGWLERLVSGVRNAFRQTALSQEVQAVTVGDKLTDVVEPTLVQQAIEQILTTLSVPHSLILSSAANYATAQRDWQTFMLVTILPHARRFASRLTQQHYSREGLVLEVVEESIEAVQDAELAKAEALQRLVASGILTISEARQRLELPPVDDPQRELARLRERAELELAALREQVTSPAQAPSVAAAESADTELRTWSDARALKAPQPPDLSDVERLLYRRLMEAFERLQTETVRAIEQGSLLDADRWSALVQAALLDAVRDAANDAALAQAALVGVLADDGQLSALVYQWAMQHTQYLVDEVLWPTTRELIEQVVAQWRATPNADRAVLLQMLTLVFSGRRAETIAITAATEAATAGARAYRDLLKRDYDLDYELVWYTAADERVCPICGALHQRRERDWGSYRAGPPAHPRCRCGVGLRPREE